MEVRKARSYQIKFRMESLEFKDSLKSIVSK